jgi:shikimate dehydrogenase
MLFYSSIFVQLKVTMLPSIDPTEIGFVPVTGILGSKISYTLSPMLHAAADDASGRMVDFQIFDVPPSGLDGWLKQVLLFGEVIGFNVTIPHKEAIYHRVDACHEEARQVGSVNCVGIREGFLVGYNTDRPALGSVIDSALNENELVREGWTVVILGAGGAARAALWAALDLKIAKEIYISSRAEERRFFMLLHVHEEWEGRGVKLIQADWLDWEKLEIGKNGNPTMLINTTPLGSSDGKGGIKLPSPFIPDEVLSRFSLVTDLVYEPSVTGLMKSAIKAGVPAVGGSGMLIEQAVRSRSIWFGEGKEEDERAAMVAVYSSYVSKSVERG